VDLEWKSILGTPQEEIGTSVAVDQYGAYVVGYTNGGLGGANLGGSDAFISRYDAFGSLQWTKQVGTPNFDDFQGAATDGFGRVFAVGSISVPPIINPDGSVQVGLQSLVNAYDSSGTLLWSNTFGAVGTVGTFERAWAVSANEVGSVYVVGDTSSTTGGLGGFDNDAFISKYNSAGGLLWTTQFGTPGQDYATGVSADGLGNVYVTGNFEGSAFLRKYDSGGTLQWTSPPIDTLQVEPRGVSADQLGNIYVAGRIFGGDAAFISRFDSAGTLHWTREFGTFANTANDVAVDGMGNVYVTGAISYDAFVRKYDSDGILLWDKTLANTDAGFGVTSDGAGTLYVSGYANGLGGGSIPGDAFLAKLTDRAPLPPSAFNQTVTKDGFDSYSDNSFVVFSDGTDVSLVPDNNGGQAVKYSYSPTDGGFLARGFDFEPVIQPGTEGANVSTRLSEYRVAFDLTIDSNYIPANGFEVWLIDVLGQGDPEGDPSASLYSISLDDFVPGVPKTVSFTLDSAVTDVPFGYTNGSGFIPTVDQIRVRLNGLDFNSPNGLEFSFTVDNFSLNVAQLAVPEPTSLFLLIVLSLSVASTTRPHLFDRVLFESL
jgi:hypothetical protein